ncbi:hypothetical protein NC652_014540 [Populus alba x Populus x berolinensis]|nr:hypothetical protein NC652_014540 [Populus alba x Populus x berolinensis]
MIIPSGFRFHMFLFLPLPVFLLHILSLAHHCGRSLSNLSGKEDGARLLYIFRVLGFSVFSSSFNFYPQHRRGWYLVELLILSGDSAQKKNLQIKLNFLL